MNRWLTHLSHQDSAKMLVCSDPQRLSGHDIDHVSKGDEIEY